MSLLCSVLNNHNLAKKALMFSFLIFSFIFLDGIYAETPDVLVAKQLFPDKLWSREEMVEMAGYGEEKLSSVTVIGFLLCNACLPDDHQPRSWPIQGASVAVKCQTGNRRKSSWTRTITDELGEFVADLPSHLHAIPNLENTCLVKVLHVPKSSNCQPANAKKHRGIRLAFIANGIRTYTAGRIKLQHFTHKSSQTCIKKE